ncbi:MAG: TIGR03960 family B12-binding radical SAM protein [Phycisphaerales bacterium]|jgi:radical SAM family uncharacterized protein|nr:TIGR03960 family B12-binding radical SAM protein [Phycisphaerales bacterium]MBT7096460.1 TIGR03960 family B12-binding radical SAM protein [Candidatus Poribacteria bacterium]
MRDLRDIVSRELLPYLDQPSQYVGLEHNARAKAPLSAEVRCVMAFPDAYTVGISHLGSQLLYATLNDIDWCMCDRAYCPPPSGEAVFRDKGVPLFGWESRHALADFDLIGVSMGYELGITNLLTMLDLAGIPLLAADRDDSHPLIILGDAMADTPEPLADFVDVVVPGDGEEVLTKLVALLRETKAAATSREETLRRIATEVESCYVPRFYAPDEFGHPRPMSDEFPAEIPRAMWTGFAESSAYTDLLVPLAEAVHERVVIEVMRGCPNLCRFCQAGHTRLPVRLRSVEDIISAAREGLAATGYDEITLLSLSTGDYPDLEGLIARLNEEFADKHVSISLPSLKVDKQLSALSELTAAVRKGGLTIAAEGGSERLRRAIKKGITEEDMLAGVAGAWRSGYRSVKMYFIAGLPGETPADLDDISALCRRLSNTRREFDNKRGNITASVSWLVPKPHTPLQWEAMVDEDYCWGVRERLIEAFKKTPNTVKFHTIEQSQLESLLCRGGREIAGVILRAWQLGARMDSWNEHWDWSIWQQAIAESDVDFGAIVHTAFDPELPTPWGHIRCHLDGAYYRKQREAMWDVLDETADEPPAPETDE